MKFYLTVFCVIAAASLFGRDLKVLMIGNSFSVCVGKNLPKMVAHEKKHSIELTSAHIGGCSLERHAANFRKAEKNPDYKPYRINVWNSKKLMNKTFRYGNVNELLKNNKYDIISIQQASPSGIKYDLFQPYADEIISWIRKYNSDAEIVLHQTWAYRADAKRLKDWGISQDEMSAKVIDAYKKFAKHTKFRVIPCGEAVAFARESYLYKYKGISEKQLGKFVYPDEPPHAADPVGKHYWSKDKNKFRLVADTTHLNEHGEYLQACVWYAFLFNEDAEKITYESLPSANCTELCRSAARAVSNYRR